MVTSRFKQAERKKLRLRLGLSGPAGSGKTATALRFAGALGQRIAVICTEHGAAAKYAGMDFGDGAPLHFDVCELSSFSPSEYTSLIEEAGTQFDVIVIDSLSHAWEGKDGALELLDQVKSQSRNQFTAWKDVTPMHRRMVEAILASPCHVIATLRAKQEYVLQKDEKGREVPVRIGMRPVQREGMEYEFDVFGDMDLNHILTITKTRCPAIDGARVVKPGAAFMRPLTEWLETGRVAAPTTTGKINRVDDATLALLVQACDTAGFSDERIKKELIKRYEVTEFTSLRQEQAKEMLVWAQAQANRGRKGQGQTQASTTATPPPPQAAQPAPTPPPAPTQGRVPTPSTSPDTAPENSIAMGRNAGAQRPDATQSRQNHPRVIELRDLVAQLYHHGLTPEAWQATLHRYGAPSECDLNDQQCELLSRKLREKLAGFQAASTPAGTGGAQANGNHPNGNHPNGDQKGGQHSAVAQSSQAAP